MRLFAKGRGCSVQQTVEEKVREDTNFSGKSHTLLPFVKRKISDELTLAAKAKARTQADHQKHNTAASLRGETDKFHFDVNVVFAEANSSFG